MYDSCRSSDLILILDFGRQYTQLIARRVREQNVYSRDPSLQPAARRRSASWRRAAIILSGGPASCYDDGRAAVDAERLRAGRADARHLLRRAADRAAARRQGRCRPTQREYGRATRRRSTSRASSFHGFGAGEEIAGLDEPRRPRRGAAAGLRASSARAPTARRRRSATPARKFWGVQFHPEVVHTPRGGEILANFLFRICGAEPTGRWPASSSEAIADDHAPRSDRRARVICGLSGGVDSSVAAALVLRAIGDRA